MPESCHLCNATHLSPLLQLGDHPVAHHFLSTPDQDEFLHPVDIAICDACNLVQMPRPVPPEQLYTNYVTLSSWKLHPHVPHLLELIQQQEDFSQDWNIIEIGSNDGVFLSELKELGCTRLLGVEPAEDARHAAQDRGVETIGEYLTRELAEKIVAERGPFDLLICRHVLEHIEDLTVFADAFRTLLKPNGVALVEVPDFQFGLDQCDYSAIWEEHVNYFTRNTFTSFLAKAGIHVEHHETARFSGQAMILLGRASADDTPIDAPEVSASEHAQAVTYGSRFPAFKSALHQYLAGLQADGRAIAIYGGGCRACSFINYTDIGPFVDCVFDDQTEKQGMLMPGSKLEIRSGEMLASSNISTCLLAVNCENEEAVLKARRDFHDTEGHIVASLHPPSALLPDFWTSFISENT